MSDDLDKEALEYHAVYPPGKLAIVATKPMATQRDLSLAYSPGVAAACMAIADDASTAATYTAKGNLVGVITNGTAVLGLGNIGALASKPVMEGKAVLFKKFSGVDVFDIEVDELDPQKFIEIVAGLEPTFGGINLEDIKAPECFEIEEALRERMNIPVFHDDQHGTAIVTASAINSALKVVGKDLAEVKLVCSGAGAAAQACLDLLVNMGLNKDNVLVLDSRGVIYNGRERVDKYKARYATDNEARTMGDAIVGADIFLGCSGPGSLTGDQVAKMCHTPIILALANPVPEIMPEEARAANPNVIMATGRSDYPNQVNNVLCFPFIFRGALDVGATTINEEMKIACVETLTKLAMEVPPEIVKATYTGESLKFGPEYLIPKPFDPRLITEVASAVAKAAMQSGVATRPIKNFRKYRDQLSQFVFKSSGVMYPIIERARQSTTRLCYAEAEDDRVLQAVQQVIDDGIAFPVLVGREQVIEGKIKELGLQMQNGKDYEIVDRSDAAALQKYSDAYLKIMGRRGVSPARARHLIDSRSTVLSCLMLHCGDVDALLCGAIGPFAQRLETINEIIGRADGVSKLSTVVGIILPSGTYFICDTHVTYNPNAQELAEMAVLAAAEVKRFGVEPKLAFVSHSNFGSSREEGAIKMFEATNLLRKMAPELEVDGEMSADAALSPVFRKSVFPDSTLSGPANLLIMPSRDAAHIAFTLIKAAADATVIGPILVGANKPANIVTQSVSVRGLVNMSAISAVKAQL